MTAPGVHRAGAAFTPAMLVLIASAASIVTLSLGMRPAFGLFMKPLSQDLGLGREVFSLALALQTLLNGLGAPLFGALADRFGVFRIVITGNLFIVLGLALGAFVQGPLGLHLTFGLLVGVGTTAVSVGVVMGAVARSVPPERRSLAFGLVMAGGSFGQFLMVPIAQALLAAHDWRFASGVLAGILALVFVLALGMRGERRTSEMGAAGAPSSVGAALAEATRHSGFWLLTAAFFVCGVHVSFVSFHLSPFLTDRGLSGNVAALALALVGLFNILGSFASGWLGTRLRHRYLLAIIYGLRGLLFLPMIFLPVTPLLAATFAAVMGILYLSTAAPTSGIVAQVFGSRHFSMLYGVVFGAHQVGGFFGSWLGGYIFDRTGSYDTAWWIMIALAVLATAMSLPIRDRPLRVGAAAA
jgi:predicted MFS family arabinose efflux permease